MYLSVSMTTVVSVNEDGLTFPFEIQWQYSFEIFQKHFLLKKMLCWICINGIFFNEIVLNSCFDRR